MRKRPNGVCAVCLKELPRSRAGRKDAAAIFRILVRGVRVMVHSGLCYSLADSKFKAVLSSLGRIMAGMATRPSHIDEFCGPEGSGSPIELLP